MSFPLYDNLLNTVCDKHLQHKRLTNDEKRYIIHTINTMFDIHEREIVYVLIRKYHMAHDDSGFYNLPCQSKLFKKGLKFNMDLFPPSLGQILLEYINIHQKSVKESFMS